MVIVVAIGSATTQARSRVSIRLGNGIVPSIKSQWQIIEIDRWAGQVRLRIFRG